jgi:hypothetical protein
LRISGNALPEIEKVLRLRCAVNASDHSTVGVTLIAVPVGGGPTFEQNLEVIFEAGVKPPRYFELVASLTPATEPTQQLRCTTPTAEDPEGVAHRVAGIMDPGETRIVLPPIVLRGG